MFKKAIRYSVAIGLVALMFAGCGRQVAKTPQGAGDPLATSPDTEVALAAPDYVSALLDASGGAALWRRQTRLHASGVVQLYRSDGSFYLTEHDIVVYPWSDAIQITANEPAGRFAVELTDGRYRILEGQPSKDVSPLSGSYGPYAAALLEIVTAPVRLLDKQVELRRETTPIRIRGQWYQQISAEFPSVNVASDEEAVPSTAVTWTNGTYYVNRGAGVIDTIWLGNDETQEYLIVKGYDYGAADGEGLRLPSKVEVFRADAEGNAKGRLAQMDVSSE